MSIVIAHDRFTWLRRTDGNVTVTVECERHEYPATVRAAARRFARDHLGTDWDLRAFIGWEYYRNQDGYPSRARRYAVVKISGPSPRWCSNHPAVPAVSSAVLPGPSGRFGAPGGRSVDLCPACDSATFARKA